MLSFLTGLITGLCNFLAGVLPDSPFRDLATQGAALQQGLAWLNWFVPIGSFGAIFAAYLAAMLVWVSVQAALDNSIKGVYGVIGGGE